MDLKLDAWLKEYRRKLYDERRRLGDRRIGERRCGPERRQQDVPVDFTDRRRKIDELPESQSTPS